MIEIRYETRKGRNLTRDFLTANTQPKQGLWAAECQQSLIARIEFDFQNLWTQLGKQGLRMIRNRLQRAKFNPRPGEQNASRSFKDSIHKREIGDLSWLLHDLTKKGQQKSIHVFETFRGFQKEEWGKMQEIQRKTAHKED